MPFDFNGKWKNDKNSDLILKQVGSSISGTFDSGVGDDGKRVVVEVQGRALDDVVTFNVIYSQFKTVVTWNGQVEDVKGKSVLKAHWLHVSDTPDPQEKSWMWFSNRIGFDMFTKI